MWFRERSLRNREFDRTAPWRVWLRERYARYWYAVGCLFVDMIIAATVLQGGVVPAEAWQYAVALALVASLTILELLGYRKLWPPESPDS